MSRISWSPRDSFSISRSPHSRDPLLDASPSPDADAKVPLVVLDDHRSPGYTGEGGVKLQHGHGADGVGPNAVGHHGHLGADIDLDGGEDQGQGVDEVDGHPLVLHPGDDVVGDGPAGVVHPLGQPLQGDRAPQTLHGLRDDGIVKGSRLNSENHVNWLARNVRKVQIGLETFCLPFERLFFRFGGKWI